MNKNRLESSNRWWLFLIVFLTVIIFFFSIFGTIIFFLYHTNTIDFFGNNNNNIVRVANGKEIYDLYTYNFRNHSLHRFGSKIFVSNENRIFETKVSQGRLEDEVTVVQLFTHTDEKFKVSCWSSCRCWFGEDDGNRRSAAAAGLIYSSRYFSVVIVSFVGFAISKFRNDRLKNCYERAMFGLKDDRLPWHGKEKNIYDKSRWKDEEEDWKEEEWKKEEWKDERDRWTDDDGTEWKEVEWGGDGWIPKQGLGEKGGFTCALDDIECEVEEPSTIEEIYRVFKCNGHCIDRKFIKKRGSNQKSAEEAASQMKCEESYAGEKIITIMEGDEIIGAPKRVEEAGSHSHVFTSYKSAAQHKYSDMFLKPYCNSLETKFFFTYYDKITKMDASLWKAIRPCTAGNDFRFELINVFCKKLFKEEVFKPVDGG